MKLSAQSHASIASSLREAVDKYIADGERTVVTDIHLQPKQDSGELVIFNDTATTEIYTLSLHDALPIY